MRPWCLILVRSGACGGSPGGQAEVGAGSPQTRAKHSRLHQLAPSVKSRSVLPQDAATHSEPISRTPSRRPRLSSLVRPSRLGPEPRTRWEPPLPPARGELGLGCPGAPRGRTVRALHPQVPRGAAAQAHEGRGPSLSLRGLGAARFCPTFLSKATRVLPVASAVWPEPERACRPSVWTPPRRQAVGGPAPWTHAACSPSPTAERRERLLPSTEDAKQGARALGFPAGRFRPAGGRSPAPTELAEIFGAAASLPRSKVSFTAGALVSGQLRDIQPLFPASGPPPGRLTFCTFPRHAGRCRGPA